MNTDDLDFVLPPELVAQAPAADRAESRLLHYRRSDRRIEHRQFKHLPSLLRPGDLLVMNDARVIPARFTLIKSTGGRVEGLFIGQTSATRWQVLLRNLGSHVGARLHFAQDASISVSVIEKGGEGQYLVEVETTEHAEQLLEMLGRMPLPPYIKRDKDRDARDGFDRERYQTVYARQPGSVAAPTAGLHFTPAIFEELKSRGIEMTHLTLHVGLGTFKPITADTLTNHAMHTERYEISAAAAAAINRAKAQHRRVIAVGTTSARVLESQPAGDEIEPKSSETAIFIYPPYRWKHVDALITNFHLPRSTLIALVAALVGLDEQRRVYAEAIAEKYRFFSYGDGSLLE
jgi:S-adenosylmethionine:tRNA ribosyltransferase-isomerase